MAVQKYLMEIHEQITQYQSWWCEKYNVREKNVFGSKISYVHSTLEFLCHGYH